mgnify:CR=1 FL=1
MKPKIRQFTRDDPCTTIHFWNCFKGRRGFRHVQVDEARADIGINAPRNMLNKGYVTIIEKGQGEYFCLTPEGESWLIKGVRAYVKNHPNERGDALMLPRENKLHFCIKLGNV